MALSNITRSNPTNYTGNSAKMLEDGHPSFLAMAANPGLAVWETSLTPPGIDGGDPIPITTMHNVTWRTMVPRKLKTLTAMSLTGGYDPLMYEQFLHVVNVNQSMTFQFSDGSDLDFFGIAQTFTPQELSEGEPPLADVDVTPSNYDPVTKVETAPVMTEVLAT